MNKKKNNDKFSGEKQFERKLYHSLKYYGYLFPRNENDVERFEGLYGDTEIDMPEHLQSLEKLKGGKEIPLDFDLSYNVAAFSGGDKGRFDLPDDLDENASDDTMKGQGDKNKTDGS